ncbi:MAG: DUF6122 family protein [Halieaceae bacterium]|uniref:DUF6122 family protein n=1 Tax=Haliea alexandrii TaxID=2448162 RepID=UPI001E4DD331|nr:DUF6122 family protein [Haliea alexandrii]MCR9186018.1 DUF6122 family protein [Halieaceae bacterium]
MLHIALHFLVPLLVAAVFFRRRWQYATVVMTATMLVDLDHLLAIPLYDPGRCSIGFHPLHQPWLLSVYLLLCVFPASRLVGLGLCLHMFLDAVDCQLTSGVWINPVSNTLAGFVVQGGLSSLSSV